jgi:hypothetical protein
MWLPPGSSTPAMKAPSAAERPAASISSATPTTMNSAVAVIASRTPVATTSL